MAVTLADYEEMADALLDAYRTGTPEAMQRHWRLTWHRREWQGMRTYVQVGLGKQAGPDVEITPDDARWLVAREHGFPDWAQLAAHVASLVPGRLYLVKPLAVLTADGDDTDARVETRDWQACVERLSQGDARDLDARGQMTDAMLADLPRLAQVTTLRLGGSGGVTDHGLQHLARLPNLRRLDLSGTAITDGGLTHLRSLPALREISLAWTRVTDAGMPALAACRSLERVNLGGTRCGDGAVAALASLPALCDFSSGSAMTDAGLAMLESFPAFASWDGPDAPAGLFAPEELRNRLQLRGTFSIEGLRALRRLHGLHALDLDDRDMLLPGAALEALVDLPHLGMLSFDAGDDAMPIIARMAQLHSLDCQDTLATDTGWSALGASTSIQRIWGRRCHGLGDAGFRALSRIPTLRSLSVSCLHVSDAAVALLPEFPALRELMPMDVPDAGYRHIGQCHALDALILMYCRETTDAATEHLGGLSALRKYFASYTRITDRTPALLAELASLESVTLDSCAGVSNAGIAHLARLPRLRELRVSGARITDDVRRHFPAQVRVRYSL